MRSIDRSRTKSTPTRSPRLRRCCVAAYLLWFSALPLAAQIVLDRPEEEITPTTADLNGAAIAPSGEIIAVGDSATVLRRTTDPDGNVTWASLNAWAAGFFTAEIFDVAHSPVAYPNGEGWVVAGRGGVVETDFTDTVSVDVRPGSNTIFTPVLPTPDEIWYGVPDLGLSPSFLHRYDRATQTNPGIAFPVGAVLAMCQVEGGNLRYVTTDGDIEEIDDNLVVTALYDQPSGQSLELNAASFSEDCEVIAGGDAGPESRIYAGFIEALRSPREPGAGPTPSPWRHADRTGEPTVTASCFLTSEESSRVIGYFALLLRCNDTVATGDEATMSAFTDLLDSRINAIGTHNSQAKCQRGGVTRPVAPMLRGPAGPTLLETFEMVTVGRGGRVQRMRGGLEIVFSDGFESGTVAAWDSIVMP